MYKEIQFEAAMKRELILGILIAAGAIAIAAAAQQAPAPTAIVQVEKLKDNLFVLRGGGGNTAVFVQTNGVTVVDTKNPGWGQPLLNKNPGADKQAGHDDHQHAHAFRPCQRQRRFPGNRGHRHAREHGREHEAYQARRISLRSPAYTGPPVNVFAESGGGRGLAKRTFRDTMTLGAGNDRIDLRYFGRGHTNGDAWVLFPALRVMHAGDIFAGKSMPLLDYNSGGSGVEISRHADEGVYRPPSKTVDSIVTGHSTVMTPNDLRECAEFNRDFRNAVREGKKSGGSVEPRLSRIGRIPDQYRDTRRQILSASAAPTSRISTRERRRESCPIAQFLAVALVNLCGVFGIVPSMTAQGPPVASCDEFLLAPREAGGHRVGPASCRSQETTLTFEGRALVRLDVGLDGTVEGYMPTIGDHKGYLTNAPDLVFLQVCGHGAAGFHSGDLPARQGRRDDGGLSARRERVERQDVDHRARTRALLQRGQSAALGSESRSADPLGDLDKYERLILAKGYTLIKTYRSTPAAPPDVPRTNSTKPAEIIARLEDGTTVEYAAFNDSANYLKDFADVARRILERRLGRAPRRTYFYGHSAGARIGRGINYTSGLNRGPDGRTAFDGFLLDDPAAGTWLPVVMKDGRDVLPLDRGRESRVRAAVRSVAQCQQHLAGKRAPYMSDSYLANKRQNARILGEKGLTPKYRFYEVRGIGRWAARRSPTAARGRFGFLICRR